MRKVRLGKKGISLVALVITIIVLIILTGAVVITGISVPKKAQLTVFYNNVATVQDAVSLQMSENMMTRAKEKKGESYKWYNIAENYIDENTAVEFTETIEELEAVELARISRELLDKTTLADEEKDKYYIDNKGTVYYEGFEYEGDTYYNQNTKVEGTALPRVRITADTGVVTNAGSITYTITFSKSVSGFTKEDITIDEETNTIEITGSGAEYTLVIPTREEDYTQIVRVEANVCQDAEENGNREGSKTITIDRGRPVVTNETSTTATKIIIKATDGAGIIGYAVTPTNAQPTEFTSCTSTTELTQEVTGKDPSTTYYVWVKDISGNVSEGKEVTTTQQPITRADIVASPTLYYGEKVNYKDENGEAYRDLDNTGDVEWKIFYADEENIYITTTRPIGGRRFDTYYNVNNRDAAVAKLLTNNAAYVNTDCAEWAHDGIRYEMFRDSYNAIVGPGAHNLTVDETTGAVTYTTNTYSLSGASGTQAELYVWPINGGLGDEYNNYWLASPSADNSNCVMLVRCYSSCVGYDNFNSTNGVRPLVCLKSNIQLEKNGDTYNISTQ